MGTTSDEEFGAFVHAHEGALLRLALVLTTERMAAEDLVQTALLRTYARWNRLRGQDPLGYARRIVTNAHIDRWRRHRGRELLTQQVPEQQHADVTSGVDERDALLGALRELSLRERQVVALRFLLDLSEADTAAQLGLAVGTVKSATHRALAKLRDSEHLGDLIPRENR